MVTIARLSDLQSLSSDEIIVANTHWDDRGLEARTNSAKLILELVREEMKESQVNGKEPLVVLLGDLNSPAEEKGYQVLTGDRYKKEEKKGDIGEEKAFWDSRHEIATRKTSLAGPGALSGYVKLPFFISTSCSRLMRRKFPAQRLWPSQHFHWFPPI